MIQIIGLCLICLKIRLRKRLTYRKLLSPSDDFKFFFLLGAVTKLDVNRYLKLL